MAFKCPVHDQRFILEHVVRIGELSNDLDIVDAEGLVVARVDKVVYVRRSRDAQRADSGDVAAGAPA